MAFTMITLTGSFQRPDGHPSKGLVTARLSEPLVNGTQTVDPSPVVGVLNAGGHLVGEDLQPLVLAANDDPATTPAGSSYQFTVQLDDADARSFTAVVSHSAVGGTVDFSTLEP